MNSWPRMLGPTVPISTMSLRALLIFKRKCRDSFSNTYCEALWPFWWARAILFCFMVRSFLSAHSNLFVYTVFLQLSSSEIFNLVNYFIKMIFMSHSKNYIKYSQSIMQNDCSTLLS